MSNYTFCRIDKSEETIKQAIKLLTDTFPLSGMWPTLNEETAIETVNDCISDGSICLGIKLHDILIGWLGIRPLYDRTWELHPMLISHDFQGKGYGKILLYEAERIASEQGIIGIFAGSDDETGKTSLSGQDINGENIFDVIKGIKNLENHPYEFYIKCGYSIIGIIPNANGHRKPDILLWKDISKKDI